ncbi:MAG: hypothetical protein KF883_11085 [Thermomicrobiales bacterium]|nr:hypothetical protein [Thermomicrobiales bacterium]
MSVKLLPETEEQIRQLVESGQFEDANAVVAQAVALLSDQQKFERLRELIAEGDEAYKRGDYYVWTENSMHEILERARERSRLGLPVSDHVKP